MESSCKVNKAGIGGKGSGELAGNKGSKPKEEHSGSGSKESDSFIESGGSVEDSAMVEACGEIGAGNTVSRSGDEMGDREEVVSVAEIVAVDVQNG